MNAPSIRWCEAAVQRVEYLNSISNISFVIAACLGLRQARKFELPWSFYVTEYTLLLIALGSFLFHYTQSWRAEMLDELPMSALGLCYLYTIKELHWLTRGRCQAPTFVIAVSTTSCAWYFYVSSRRFHVFQLIFTLQLAFPALVSRAAAADLECDARLWNWVLGLILLGKGVWSWERHLYLTGECPSSPSNPLYWCHATWHVLSAAAHAVAMAYHKDLYLAARALKLVSSIQPSKRATSTNNLLDADDGAITLV